jgi:hypothetical protein|tara:strand:+ start:726 stop:890 length:165 start_codon:yes stop_codon:yes gene_type:complete
MYKGLTVEQTREVVKMLDKLNTPTWEDYKEINKIITYILKEDLRNETCTEDIEE